MGAGTGRGLRLASPRTGHAPPAPADAGKARVVPERDGVVLSCSAEGFGGRRRCCALPRCLPCARSPQGPPRLFPVAHLSLPYLPLSGFPSQRPLWVSPQSPHSRLPSATHSLPSVPTTAGVSSERPPHSVPSQSPHSHPPLPHSLPSLSCCRYPLATSPSHYPLSVSPQSPHSPLSSLTFTPHAVPSQSCHRSPLSTSPAHHPLVRPTQPHMRSTLRPELIGAGPSSALQTPHTLSRQTSPARNRFIGLELTHFHAFPYWFPT